jgi:hypothetical protein
MNHLEAAQASLDQVKLFARRGALARNPQDQRMFFDMAKRHKDAAAKHLALARSVGPSSGTDVAEQSSMAGGPGSGFGGEVGLPTGPYGGSDPYQQRLDDGVTNELQPGGVGSGQDLSETTVQPGGRDEGGSDLDDGGGDMDDAPEGVDPEHHKTLAAHGYRSSVPGAYFHQDGTRATSGFDEDGKPRTQVEDKLFDDAGDLSDHLDQRHGSSRASLGDPDERAAQSFIASKGNRPEVVEWVMGQLREFRSRPNFFRSGSDLTIERFLEVNWRFR